MLLQPEGRQGRKLKRRNLLGKLETWLQILGWLQASGAADRILLERGGPELHLLVDEPYR